MKFILYFLLDSYKVHKNDLMENRWKNLVENRLMELGVGFYFIPPECTSLVQVVDVGVAKSFKDWLRDEWMDWAIELGDGMVDFLPSTCEEVVECINTSLCEVKCECD